MAELTQAQREAYARAHTSLVYVRALELRHPVWPGPVRLVDHRTDLVCPLESNAPIDGGTNQLFVGMAFSSKDPSIDTESDTTVSIRVDGVSGAVQPYLREANQTIYPVDATVRYYNVNLGSGVIDGPVAVIHQQVRDISASKTSVSLTLGYTNTANKAFPGQLYTPETNPGL